MFDHEHIPVFDIRIVHISKSAQQTVVRVPCRDVPSPPDSPSLCMVRMHNQKGGGRSNEGHSGERLSRTQATAAPTVAIIQAETEK